MRSEICALIRVHLIFRSILSVPFSLLLFAVHGQVPTKCLEIESLLVDACVNSDDCPGSQEAHNEWVRFKIGPADIALNDLLVVWPNNPWQGFVQDASTASLVTQMNATVQGCGWLVEPPNDHLPAGATVLLVSSTLMCPTANPFTDLNDTLHVVFQAPGNNTAHLLNHNNGPDTLSVPIGPPITRTVIISHVPAACHDTVTYLPQQLVNIYGNHGGLSAENDGAAVEFSWPGVPQSTYLNHGCQAPFTPLVVIIDPPIGPLCSGGSVQLSAQVSSPVNTVYWQGGSGTFSDPNGLSTTYIAGPQDTGDVILEFCAENACGEPVCANVVIVAGQDPQVTIINGDTVPSCMGDVIDLVAIGNGDLEWNTGSTNDTLTIDSPGTYTVHMENSCGSDSASVVVLEGIAPIAQIMGDTTLCENDTVILSAIGGISYLWNTGSTDQTIDVTGAGEYWVIAMNGCGSDTAFIQIDPGVTAAFVYDADTDLVPVEVTFLNLSVPDDVDYFWEFGDGSSTTEDSPTHFYTSPGSFVVTLTAMDGDCQSTVSSIIIVSASTVDPGLEEVESSIAVPNVFTPNGDGNNDQLELQAVNITSVEMGIYNRWGQKIYSIELPRQIWDGRSFSGEPATEGTYFFELRAAGGDGKEHELRGSFTLIR